MTFGNDRKELRKGEKLTVTIDEVLHNTILVFLEYRKAKFCGALLNTTNRRGPYGIEEQPDQAYYRAYGIDPNKLNLKNEDDKISEKSTAKVHFPQPLDIRTTYGQKIEQPPPRAIYMRRRRSKRKVRMDMMDTDLAIRLATSSSGRKMLSHPAHCCCDKCASGFMKLSTAKKSIDEKKSLSDEKKTVRGKRKLLLDGKKENQPKSEKNDAETAKPLSKEPKRIKLDKKVLEKGIENPTKTDSAFLPIKRSPVIKISYKSPGGRGRVLKIPSRLHSPQHLSNNNDKTPNKSAMHERARKVVNRAKNEHFKYLQEHNNEQSNSKLKEKLTREDPSDTVAKLKQILKKIENPASLRLAVASNRNARRKSPSPHNSADSDSNWTPPKHISVTDKPKKITPRKKTEQVENGENESLNSIKGRQLRNLHPTVVLSPLSSERATEAANAIPSSTDKANTPSQNVIKAKPKVQKEGSETEELQSSSSNAVGASLSHRRRLPASHSISVTRCTTKEGVKWCQGDVVWGKIMGFPWWPGLVQKIVVKKAENSLEQIAVVDWFQSKTVSHIPCTALESFSEGFKKRFVRKLRGKYRKAIQDARDAEKEMSKEVRQLIMQFET